jgi:hypothetical protein
MKLDVPHGLHRLPPAPELRRTQDTANPSHKEHIYLYVLAAAGYLPTKLFLVLARPALFLIYLIVFLDYYDGKFGS